MIANIVGLIQLEVRDFKLIASPSLQVVTTVILLMVALSWLTGNSSSTRSTLPPGPHGLPLIGNIFQLSEDSWHIFTVWKEKYGDIFYFRVFGQKILVVNSLKAAFELFDRRAAVYSDRPHFVVACDMLTEGLFMTFVGHNDIWKRMRRVAHEGLHKGVTKRFHPIQTKETAILLHQLRHDSADWENHIRRAVGSTILSLTYDLPSLKSVEGTELEHIFAFTKKIVRAAYVDSYFVEYFPWIRHLPSLFLPWKREAINDSLHYSKLFTTLYNDTKMRLFQGDERPSFAASVINKQQKHELSDKQAIWLVATVAAASETMAGVLAWFMLAMVMYPDVQSMAQKELDEIIGRDRLPSFADYEQLHFIRATLKEVLRWHPIDPLGMQHRVIEDDVYSGYFIPRGTICIANVWAMNRDKSTFGPDADVFNPQRHLDETGKLKPSPAFTRDESHVTFGFGRRICIGRHVANDSLFLAIAQTLWMFKITRPVNPDGSLPPLSEESINQGLVVRPLPYNHKFTLRFDGALDILENRLEELNMSGEP